MHVELKANYLDLWAQVPYPVGPLFLGLGVNFGAFIGGTQKVEAEFYGLEISEEADLESDALGADVGLNFGVSLLNFCMEALQKLIENNPGLFRIIGIVLGLSLGYAFYLLFMS